MSMRWDPDQYHLFLNERTKPAIDLLNHVRPSPSSIIDMGCGTGNSTRLIQQQFPHANLIGVDQSESMINRAKHELPSIPFILEDMNTYCPDTPVDLIYSNAAIQWSNNPLLLIEKWGQYISENGQLAIQFPINYTEPSHQLIHDTLDQLKFPSIRKLGEFLPSASDIVASLSELGFNHIDMWDTTYYHHFSHSDKIVSWMQGSGLRPAFINLSDADQLIFLEEYKKGIERYYPTKKWGVLFPFFRRFLVATKK